VSSFLKGNGWDLVSTEEILSTFSIPVQDLDLQYSAIKNGYTAQTNNSAREYYFPCDENSYYDETIYSVPKDVLERDMRFRDLGLFHLPKYDSGLLKLFRAPNPNAHKNGCVRYFSEDILPCGNFVILKNSEPFPLFRAWISGLVSLENKKHLSL